MCLEVAEQLCVNADGDDYGGRGFNDSGPCHCCLVPDDQDEQCALSHPALLASTLHQVTQQ